jgi:hypothetical protein
MGLEKNCKSIVNPMIYPTSFGGKLTSATPKFILIPSTQSHYSPLTKTRQHLLTAVLCAEDKKSTIIPNIIKGGNTHE